jgi:hypothetical protein
MSGVLVGFVTVPLTPLAVVTETLVTDPPAEVEASVPEEKLRPLPTVTLLKPPALLP